MKKGKIKQFFEENWGVLALIIWGLLMCYFFVGITSDLFSITKKKILFAVIILYPVAGIIMMIRAGDKLQKQRAEAYEKEHLELKERYKYPNFFPSKFAKQKRLQKLQGKVKTI